MGRIVVFLCCLLSLPLWGQDKKAKNILDKLGQKYDSYKTVEVDLEMTLEFPGRETETSQVKIIQHGEKFVYISPSQEMYCDGKDVWLYLVDRNEVQINNLDESADGDIITPVDLLSEYRTGYFKYRLVSSDKQNSLIELVPTDEWDDYSKYSLTIDKKSTALKKILAIGKDGSRILFEIEKLVSNKNYTDDQFRFDVDGHKDVTIEDLRID